MGQHNMGPMGGQMSGPMGGMPMNNMTGIAGHPQMMQQQQGPMGGPMVRVLFLLQKLLSFFFSFSFFKTLYLLVFNFLLLIIIV